MNLDGKIYISYWNILEENGWHREDNRIYPPYGSFWIEGSDEIPLFMIEKAHDGIKHELEKLMQESDKKKFERQLDDMKSYLEITEKIIVKNSLEK